MLIKLPVLKLFYNPRAAFRELVQTQPTSSVFLLFILGLILLVSRMPINPTGLAALAKISAYFPWISNPTVLRVVVALSVLIGTTIFSLNIYLAAQLSGHKTSFRTLWTVFLFNDTITSCVQHFCHGHIAIWAAISWRWILSIIAISTISGLSTGPALVACVLGYIGEMTLLILIASAVLISTGGKFREKQLEKRSGPPALTTVNIPADYSWAAMKLDGRPVDMNQFKGKVVVLNFWATWCAPCRVEIPSLQRLYDQVKNQDIVVMAVSEEDLSKVQNFLNGKNYTMPFYVQHQRPPLFSSQAYPTTFIIAPNGYVVAKKEGADQWDSPGMITYLKSLKNAPLVQSQAVNLGLNDSVAALVLHNEGIKLTKSGQFKEAEDCLTRALAIAEKDPGSVNTAFQASLQEAFGFLDYKRGQYSEAEAYYNRAFLILHTLPNPSAATLAMYDHNLSTLHEAMHSALTSQKNAADRNK